MTHVPVSYPTVGETELGAIQRVMQSGYLGMGSETQKFEEELKQYLGGEPDVVCTNSGTAALHLACQALQIGRGDEVLVPSFTFVACFQAISATGATPVPCDVGDDGLLCLADAGKRLSDRTRAILYVHYGDQVGDLSRLYRFAKKHGLRLIEDGAHVFGSEFEGQLIGSLGDIVCFSFDPVKSVTCGEGGAIVSRDPLIVSRCRIARVLGIETETDWQGHGLLGRDFDVHHQGYRYQMPDIMAAIGRVQLGRFRAGMREQRIELRRYYYDRLTNLDSVGLLGAHRDVVSYCLPVRILDGKRDRARELLLSAGYLTSIHYKPGHLLAKYSSGECLPRSERLFYEILTLPFHLEVGHADIDKITSILASL